MRGREGIPWVRELGTAEAGPEGEGQTDPPSAQGCLASRRGYLPSMEQAPRSRAEPGAGRPGPQALLHRGLLVPSVMLSAWGHGCKLPGAGMVALVSVESLSSQSEISREQGAHWAERRRGVWLPPRGAGPGGTEWSTTRGTCPVESQEAQAPGLVCRRCPPGPRRCGGAAPCPLSCRTLRPPQRGSHCPPRAGSPAGGPHRWALGPLAAACDAAVQG